MTTAYPTLRLDGREYVCIPKDEFKRMQAEDRADAAKARRAISRYRAGKSKAIPLSQLKQQLGLSK